MSSSNLKGESNKNQVQIKIEERNDTLSKQKQRTKTIKGHWSNIQQFKYFLFLYHHKDQFAENQIRRSLRLFKCMAIFIETRNPGQCRTHHQKTIQKFGGIKESIESFSSNMPKFFEKYERIKKNLQILEDMAFCGDFDNYKELVKPSSQSCKTIQSNDAKQRQQIQKDIKNTKQKQNQMQHKSVNVEQFPQSGCNLYQFYWQPVYTIPSIIFINKYN